MLPPLQGWGQLALLAGSRIRPLLVLPFRIPAGKPDRRYGPSRMSLEAGRRLNPLAIEFRPPAQAHRCGDPQGWPCVGSELQDRGGSRDG